MDTESYYFEWCYKSTYVCETDKYSYEYYLTSSTCKRCNEKHEKIRWMHACEILHIIVLTSVFVSDSLGQEKHQNEEKEMSNGWVKDIVRYKGI